MLNRGLLLVTVLLLLSAAPVRADDQWIDKNGHGADLGLSTSPKDEGSPTSASTIDEKASKPQPMSLGDVLRVLCASTAVESVVVISRNPICLGLKRSGGIDAAGVARKLSDRLELVTPELHTSPRAPVKALVGLETWLWVPRDQWHALTKSASLGGTTVTVTAEPIQTRWAMGEGPRICSNPGRVWHKGLGQDATTPCGFTYEHTSAREPDGKYRISAVLRYRVTWTCEGDCSSRRGRLGTIDSRRDSAALEVSERQTVVVNP